MPASNSMVGKCLVMLVVLSLVATSVHGNGQCTTTSETNEDGTCISSEKSVSKESSFPRWNPRAAHPCNVRQMTWAQVLVEFGPSGLPPMFPDPLVILDAPPRNQIFQDLSQEDRILDSFPLGFNVTLSSSNSFSEHRRTIPFAQYLEELRETTYPMKDDSSSSIAKAALSNETWYLFGETYSPEWKAFLKNYQLPLCEACLADSVALSFGIGNCGSGVQWHVHGPGFSEAVIGKKHWILYQNKPDFHKDQTSLNWMETNYMKMELDDRPLECTLNPGDLIYFPNMWWHATINLDDYTAFVSTFTQEHLFV